MFWRFNGRGRAGEEERGSKAGSNADAGRLVPAMVEVKERTADVDGSAGSLTAAADAVRGGDECIVINSRY